MIVRAYIHEENMEPFDMATATNKRSGQTVIADLNGIIELPAQPDDTIHIEAMGYLSKDYKAFQVPPHIIMQPDINELPPVELTFKKKSNNNWIKATAILAITLILLKLSTYDTKRS